MKFLEKIKKKFKEMEFSKFICSLILLVIGFTAIFTIFYHEYLQYLSINNGGNYVPSDALPITCVTGILCTFLSYCLYQLGLKISRNKHGIDSDGVPYEVKNQESGYEELKKKIQEYIDSQSGGELEFDFDAFDHYNDIEGE